MSAPTLAPHKRGGRRLTAEDRATIGAEVRGSHNPPEAVARVCERYGITRAYAYQLARQGGQVRHNGWQHLWRVRPVVRRACSDLADIGWSDGAIADVVGLTVTLVKRSIDAEASARAKRPVPAREGERAA